MDSFIPIPISTDVPSNNENGGAGGNAYCVVAHTTTSTIEDSETPINMENGGSGGNAYCVVA